jgi:hypothetical protein
MTSPASCTLIALRRTASNASVKSSHGLPHTHGPTDTAPPSANQHDWQTQSTTQNTHSADGEAELSWFRDFFSTMPSTFPASQPDQTPLMEKGAVGDGSDRGSCANSST